MVSRHTYIHKTVQGPKRLDYETEETSSKPGRELVMPSPASPKKNTFKETLPTMNLSGYQQTVSVIRVEKKIEIHHAPVKWFANFARKSLQMTCLGPCPLGK